MANDVFANGMEIACKKASGKVIACLPNVVFTPPDKVPPTPLGVPVPYPQTAKASKTAKGSKKVRITKKEVMLRNKSYLKTSMGDIAGKAAKKGILTSQQGKKSYYNRWSMNVKFEGKNVDRHFDIATQNHASMCGNTPPWIYTDTSASGGGTDDCKNEKQNEKDACSEYKPNDPEGKDVCQEAGLDGKVVQKNRDAKKLGFKNAKAWADDKSKKAAANDCVKARRCQLVPYNGPKDGISGCCPSQTPDHLIPKSSFYKKSVRKGKKMPGWKKYDPSTAPCMCAEGASNTAGSHGLRHAHHKANGPGKGKHHSFDAEAKLCADGAAEVFPSCSSKCIEAQLKQGHKDFGDTSKPVKHSPSGSRLSLTELKNRLKSHFTKKAR